MNDDNLTGEVRPYRPKTAPRRPKRRSRAQWESRVKCELLHTGRPSSSDILATIRKRLKPEPRARRGVSARRQWLARALEALGLCVGTAFRRRSGAGNFGSEYVRLDLLMINYINFETISRGEKRVEGDRFDELSRALAQASRRSLLRGLAAMVGGVFAGLRALAPAEPTICSCRAVRTGWPRSSRCYR
jgi:hypothetical protein